MNNSQANKTTRKEGENDDLPKSSHGSGWLRKQAFRCAAQPYIPYAAQRYGYPHCSRSHPGADRCARYALGEIICANNENRDVYQRDVEQWFHIRRSSVTAILQGMEQDGFITRCSVEKDARLKRLAATPKGVAYHDRIRASIDRFEQDLQQGLTPEEMAAARVVLNQILHNAQSIEAEAKQSTPERSNETC